MLDDFIELVLELALDIFFDSIDLENGPQKLRIGWVIFFSIVIIIGFAVCMHTLTTMRDNDMKIISGIGAAMLVVLEICLWRKYIKSK